MIHDGPGTADTLRADLKVAVRWTGGLQFDSKEGPSPPEALLCALATCTAVDVVLILQKRKTPVASLDVDVTAERKDTSPRRITKAHLGYRITGAGIEEAQALRAIELAVTKYCTVRDTLDPDMPITWDLRLG